jgi:GNAT superfamily N-acetyltransferase
MPVPPPRPATLEDVPALLDLSDDLVALDWIFDSTLDKTYNRSTAGVEWLKSSIADADTCVRVCDIANATGLSGMIVGRMDEAAPWRRTNGMLAELELLSIAPSWRGQGIGKMLTDAFAHWARERGATRLWVRVSAGNAGAIRFYQREGFGDYDLILERNLPDVQDPTHLRKISS